MSIIPGFVIAGTHSGVGKTTIATALMAALVRRGKRVQAFKIGPDFIDPSFHTLATGRPGRNLDGWILTRETNIDLFSRACATVDIAVVEGVMGLFDGHDGKTESGSTAEMAKWLGMPVILVVDAAALARSVAAIVRGFEEFDPDLEVAGIVCNRVAGEGHSALLSDALANCRTELLGCLIHEDEITVPERHLGLVRAEEVMTEPRLSAMASWVEAGLDLNALIELAGKASKTETEGTGNSEPMNAAGAGKSGRRPRIGIARDRAFCFYYQDNLDLLARCGAELIEFSPIAEARLPERLDGLYLGGGYPELHGAELSANRSMCADIRGFARSGAPVYAECGGFMYLTEAIVDAGGKVFPMVGVFPTRSRMKPHLAALGYLEVEGLGKAGWLRSGERARGHEFRYSVIDEMPASVPRIYRVRSGNAEHLNGYSIGATLGSYIHLHFESCPAVAERFLAACAKK